MTLLLDAEYITEDTATKKHKQPHAFFNLFATSKEKENEMIIKNGTAIISIYGALSNNTSGWMFASGTSYKKIQAQLEEAVNNDEVKDITLVFDSAGGMANGVETTANKINQAKNIKKVTAIVEGYCLSGAYWLASQCTEILATGLTSKIGSVGTMVQMYKNNEIKNIVSSYTPKKNSEDVEEIQTELDEITEIFFDSVAAGRGWNEKDYKELAKKTGEGKVFLSKAAIKMGLIDGYYKEKNTGGVVMENKETTQKEINTQEAREILALAGVDDGVITAAFSGLSSGEYAKKLLQEKAEAEARAQAEEAARVKAEAETMAKIKAEDKKTDAEIENIAGGGVNIEATAISSIGANTPDIEAAKEIAAGLNAVKF